MWQDARSLIKGVYRHTKAFPRSEIYGLVSQLNRSAVSIAANIAEGSSRMSRKDQAHFSEIAYGSLMELACLLIVAVDLEYVSADEESALRQQIEIVSRQLNALRKAQLSS
ncbi:MAG: four helix bundle protein [Spartobacteria bacterium]